MTEEEISVLFLPLRHALDDDFHWLVENKPWLAHYTSIELAEKILRDEEVWFSNPLFMNDLEELRFGMCSKADEFFGNFKRSWTSPAHQ
jgi:hypothetical protein